METIFQLKNIHFDLGVFFPFDCLSLPFISFSLFFHSLLFLSFFHFLSDQCIFLLILLLVLGTAQKVRSPIKVAPRWLTTNCLWISVFVVSPLLYSVIAPYNLSWCFFLIYILTSFRSPIKDLCYLSTSSTHQSGSEARVYTNI